MRIGVFVCHCGTNIAGTVDSKGIAARAAELKDVVHTEEPWVGVTNPDDLEVARRLIAEMRAR